MLYLHARMAGGSNLDHVNSTSRNMWILLVEKNQVLNLNTKGGELIDGGMLIHKPPKSKSL